jgi:hypothetical protein
MVDDTPKTIGTFRMTDGRNVEENLIAVEETEFGPGHVMTGIPNPPQGKP